MTERTIVLRVEDIRWAHGDWWPVLLLLPALLVPLYLAFEAWRARVARGFGGRDLLPRMLQGPSGWRRLASAAAVLVALELMAVAALRPRWGLKEVAVRGLGIDVAVVLDASRSMKASDVAPDRLTASVVEITRLMEASKGNRWALVPFSGLAFVQSPLTVDTGVIEQYLAELRVTDLPVPGTAVGRALAVAGGALGLDREEGPGGSAVKAVVLFTDGENHEGEPLKVAEALAARGARLYTVGVGTPAGQPVPVLDENGAVTGTAREADGVTPVLSKLNESLLRDLAAKGGGTYLALTPGSDVATALAGALDGLQKTEYQAQVDRLLEDRFQWPLGAAVPFLLLPFLLAGRARRRPAARGTGAAAVLAAAIVAGAAGSATAAPRLPSWLVDRDHPGVADALDLLKEGKSGDAAKALSDLVAELPGRADLLYDLALAREAAGDLDGAVEAARQALAARTATAEVPEGWPPEARLWHAQGTLLGRKALQQGDRKDPPREVRATWRQAVEALTRAVVLDPAAEDSRRNLELAAAAAYPPCAKLDDKYEPNDGEGAAQFLPLDPNSLEAKEDLLLCPGNEDHFRLPLREGETLFASVREPAEEGAAAPPGDPAAPGAGTQERKPARVDLALREGAGGPVRQSAAKDVRLKAAAATEALLAVTGPKEEDGIPYALEARVVPPCPAGDDGMEPNDSREAPKPVQDGDHGLRACPGNEDWFAYTEKQGTRKEIAVTVPPGEGPLDLEVLSADGTALDVRQQAGEGGETLSALLPKAEQDAPFWVRVHGGDRDGFYQLSIRDPQGGGGDDRPQPQQQPQQQPQAGSRTLRELLESIDRNAENLEAREAARNSPWRDSVPDKDW